ncbi:hypothetical protein Y1Q_0008639 [Alligator mississippiensis]|uniref:Uncharacterized protein n=1 Tax=Alligator mississippiensis TaxID=8496 RepID=A0A151N9Z5_ALLMI|nr:hypothetical protein Y1Q_0008639 [Alligator mississippiensis]
MFGGCGLGAFLPAFASLPTPRSLFRQSSMWMSELRGRAIRLHARPGPAPSVFLIKKGNPSCTRPRLVSSLETGQHQELAGTHYNTAAGGENGAVMSLGAIRGQL